LISAKTNPIHALPKPSSLNQSLPNMSARKAHLTDAIALSVLVHKSAILVQDDLDDQGRLLVDNTNTSTEFSKRLLDPEYSIFCFEHKQNLLGMISMFQFEKVDQLFVDPGFFKRGIASLLWEHAHEECKSKNKEGYYWVRSSSMAVPVYLKFGFCKVGATQTKNGISHQLLELKTVNSLN
jgi:GNAT superfamily N-acetyltransferase